ncbi:Glycerol-3-phosphate acyltransferase 1 [Nymphaea thermarum]|nr:Glycerol-3-phosphate acyltransferase 1 [Nymphaea thermarum]
MADNLMLFSVFLHSFLRALRLPFVPLRKLRYPRSHSSRGMRASFASCPSATKVPIDDISTKTMLCHLDSALLRSDSTFAYFMLVAFEGGSLLRALLLLLTSPFLFLLNEDLRLRVMVFVSFCGLKKEGFKLGRSVLPKFFLEDVDLEGFQALMSANKRVVFSGLPTVMIEGFLLDYLGVDLVVGSELSAAGGYYTGLLQRGGGMGRMVVVLKNLFGEKKADVGLENIKASDYHWLSCCKRWPATDQRPRNGIAWSKTKVNWSRPELIDWSSVLSDIFLINSVGIPNAFQSHKNNLRTERAQEAYMVGASEKRSRGTALPKEMYPKPLIFHDGRLAFRPTPLATLAMFIWLPLGFLLAILRSLVGLFCPYSIAMFVGSFLGLSLQLKVHGTPRTRESGVLYVCNHRTLLDPLYLSGALHRPVTAVTYSLSRISELLSPIRTARLTRDRMKDGEKMKSLLSKGDLAVCPEGTTCREPYLLRFSPLFAELTDQIVPVALNVSVSMFYGTTASGLKCLDPLFFLMNPFPAYYVEIFEKLPQELTCTEGQSSRYEVANHVQKMLADALGFECTMLTRKDKYMVLAGNEGIVPSR